MPAVEQELTQYVAVSGRDGLPQEHWVSGWITGFVDGEGCFSINFMRQPDRPGRRGYTMGYQVAHEFSVVQGESSVSSLEKLREFFGCGDIYINNRADNHRENLKRFTVRQRRLLLQVIIPFFERNPLQTAKQQNFLKFQQCLNLISQGAHLNRHGLEQLVRIAETMNHRRPRPHILADIATRESR